jgi:probable rRNA maturation factor
VSIIVSNLTRGSIPRIQFEKIVNITLPRNYELSIVFVGQARSKKLNSTYRGKNKPTNVLSFPISKTSGEIFIDTTTAKKELKKFGMTYKKFITYLLIHGLLHLKGMDHGDRMERAEQKILNGATNNNWY